MSATTALVTDSWAPNPMPYRSIPVAIAATRPRQVSFLHTVIGNRDECLIIYINWCRKLSLAEVIKA
jgi:hypothetical protein